jgi:heme-degrading monooxygenase HmoA
MYVVIDHYHLSIPVDQIRPRFEEAAPLVASMPGFQGAYLLKDANDRATLLLFWDTETDAENANKRMGPSWFANNVAPHLASPPQRSVSEVILQQQK